MSERDSVIQAAEKYLFHGLVEHDGSKVPLAEGVVRIEQGRNTGDGADGLRQALAHEVMNVITGIRNIRWVVEDEQAVAFYGGERVYFPGCAGVVHALDIVVAVDQDGRAVGREIGAAG